MNSIKYILVSGMLNRGAFGSLFGKLMKPLRITENAYVHTDRLGSITNIKNKKGSDMSNSWYDAWENVTTNISSSLSSAYSDMVENLSRHYTTYLYDDITDKYYACDRTYDSAVKRFTTRDAVKGDIRNASMLNAYIYVLNNPLKYIDPMGQSPVSAIGDWASSVGSTVGNALGAVKNTVGSVMNSIGNAFKGAADSAWSVISDIKDSITNFSPSQFLKDARDSIAGVVGTFQQSVSSFFEAMSGSGISYNEGSTDTGIPAWGKIALGITGAAIAIGILAGTMGGMAAAVSVGSELLLGSLLGGATDAAISLACGERDTNELLHDLADGAIDGFMFTGIFAPIGAAGAVSRYAKNAEGFVSKGSISKAGYGAESGRNSKYYNPDGSPIWPPNRGFDGNPTKVTLEPGTLIDRYGYDGGTFVSPKGISYTERSLPIGTDQKPYTVFEVVKSVDVQAGKIAPWFGENGGGIQYEFSQKISDLLEQGILRKVQN